MLVPRTCRTVVSRPRALPAFDRLLEDMFAGVSPTAPAFAGTAEVLPIDSREDEKGYTVVAEVPGLTAKEITITVDGRTLEISGERREPEADDSVTIHRRERYAGRFSRKLRFPADVDAKHVEAKVEHGLLTVTLPKAESSLPRKITVKG